MALRKPLVVVDGQVQQLQSGDTLDAATSGKDLTQLTNGNTNAITIGQVVYISGNDTVDLAKANASATSKAVGLVADSSIANDSSGNIQMQGVISNTDWTTVVGSTTLTAGATYYLDNATAGKMTTTAPTSGYVVEIGTALSGTDFNIEIKSPIKL